MSPVPPLRAWSVPPPLIPPVMIRSGWSSATAIASVFNEEPIDYAAFAYDGINILTGAIEKTGLNRGRIMKVLREYQLKTYDGVTGRAYFDYTLNNLAPVTMVRVENGKFIYWQAPAARAMKAPWLRTANARG